MAIAATGLDVREATYHQLNEWWFQRCEYGDPPCLAKYADGKNLHEFQPPPFRPHGIDPLPTFDPEVIALAPTTRQGVMMVAAWPAGRICVQCFPHGGHMCWHYDRDREFTDGIVRYEDGSAFPILHEPAIVL